VERFAAGDWPTPAMKDAGFDASPGALTTIRQVAQASGKAR
jgi:hypothetical protein